ncbi:MAG: DUF1549 domain-containing protein, partial [Pirellulaceae bacterium]
MYVTLQRRHAFRPSWVVLLFPFAAFITLALRTTVQADEARLSYNAHIRSLLSDKCFACHGPDEETREAGLRLDVRQAAVDFGAITPGDPQSSLVVERILTDDPDLVMPPPSSGKQLSAEEKERLKDWISEGAAYQSHWAFEPIEAVNPPSVNDASWCRNPIDRFILSRLEKQGLSPSAPADRRTLIRRLYLDLVGLLPSIDIVEDYVNDTSPEATDRLIESLLQSEHYGERWGRHWLDQARYADSNGYT